MGREEEDKASNLISIIVPIYNSEQYVYDCVNSVLKQTFPDFELILIDDGSLDSSGTICKQLCEKDERIHFIQQKHKGVSFARNEGINAAKGNYLFFLDSDDLIHPQLLEVLWRLQEKSGSVIATEGRYTAGYDGGQEPKEWQECVEGGVLGSIYLDSQVAIEIRNFNNPKTALYGIGGKMIQRKIIGSMRFDSNLTHGEDTLFMYQLIADGADVSALNCNWYYYRNHSESATKLFSIAACRSRYQVLKYIIDHEIKYRRFSNAVLWERNVVLEYLIRWYEIGQKEQDHKLIEYVKDIARDEIKTEVFTEIKWEEKKDFYRLFFRYSIVGFFYVGPSVLKEKYTKSIQCFLKQLKKWLNMVREE